MVVGKILIANTAGASAGIEWIGTATGTVRSSLGVIKDGSGPATRTITAGTSRGTPLP